MCDEACIAPEDPRREDSRPGTSADRESTVPTQVGIANHGNSWSELASDKFEAARIAEADRNDVDSRCLKFAESLMHLHEVLLAR